MKKLLSGEKIGLKIELSRIDFLLLFFFLSSRIYPQIPINGFCKLNHFQFTKGYSKVFSLNFNNDSYTDLMLYDPSKGEVSIVAGNKNETFDEEKKFDFSISVSEIIPIREKNNKIYRYAFASRKNLTAGVCEFAADGKPKILQKHLFNSYPGRLGEADIDGDSQQEILVSGPAFEGLSILKFTNKKITEIKITEKSSYSEAIFVDVSNDSLADIAGLNLPNNSLELFINDGRGNFKLTRSIWLNEKAGNLHAFDMNLDSYHDIVFSEGKKIKIFYGDFSSSYSQRIDIDTKYIPDEFIIGDFNRDGEIDVAYLNKDFSLVSVIFSEGNFKFYPEIVLFKNADLTSIIPFYSRFIDGLAVLSDDGKLITNTRLSSLSSDLDVSLSVDPSDIFYFDANNNSINDLCFIDNFDKRLKLIIRDNEGIPATFYSIPLQSNHEQFAIASGSKQSADFFCFSNGKKLIEAVSINFSTGKFTKDEFYSARPIKQIKAANTDDLKLFVSSLTGNKLSIEIYMKEGRWKLFTDQIISEEVIAADLSSFKGSKIFFWKIDGDSVKLFKKTFLPEEQKAELILKLKMEEASKFITISSDFFNIDKESVISFVESNEKQYILVNRDRLVKIFNIRELNKLLEIISPTQLFAGEIRISGTKRLVLNNFNDQSIYKLNILRGGNQIIFSKMLDKINAKKFFIKNMTVKNYHLVYINRDNQCISIRQI